MNRGGRGPGGRSICVRTTSAVRVRDSAVIGVVALQRLVALIVVLVDRGLACASLTIDRRRHLTAWPHAIPAGLHRCCCWAGWLWGVVLMQGCPHLRGHDSVHGGALQGAQGAVLAASQRRRVRNDGVEGRSGAARWHGDQTRMFLLLRALRRGSVVRVLLSIVGAWSGVGRMLLLLDWLLRVVLGV